MMRRHGRGAGGAGGALESALAMEIDRKSVV